ncbi:MAG: MATE family efflux transporter [Burkholderiaceae bacterium]|jgi:MATE family multidrug resistance protein|nr:MATE family efflux transporter [Burkholderiaceae bacterium]
MTERKTILKHAGTVLIGQLAVVAFGVTDTIIAGRYDPQALAVLSVSSAVYVSVYVTLLGVIQALLPMFAELYGGKKFSSVGELLRQSLYVWLALSVIGAMVLLSPYYLLESTQVPVSIQAEAQSYLGILAVALPAALFFRLYSSLNQSIGKPRLVTWIQIAALLCKIPLSIVLTFGTSASQGMGIAGCALATVIVSFVMCFIALILLWRSDIYQRFEIWKPMAKPDFAKLKQMAKLGIPNGVSVLVEVTSFTLMALFIARQGTTATASHQIAANMTALLYMIPLSFSIAISARLSYWIGAANFQQMRHVLAIGFQFVVMEALLLATVLFIFSNEIAMVYAKDDQVAKLSAQLLLLVGFYHIGDAVQTLCFFVLRSFKVTFLPMMVYGSMLWGVGLSGGYLLAYEGIGNIAPTQSPDAFWLMSVIALVLVCVGLLLLIGRVLRSTKYR